MRRILELEIIGNSRGAEAMLNRLNGGLTQFGRNTRRQTNELSLMDRQLLAIGTTARYALAGSLVFGITGAISRLNDFNNQLGVTAGLLTQMGQGGQIQTPSNNTIQQIGDIAELAANRVGIATDDVQSYMSRFYSTFQVNPNSRRAITDMKAFTDEVTRLQALMGAEAGDPQQLAGGIAGFVNQIPGGRRNIGRTTNRVANLIGFLTQETPNITGRDISRDIGRVGATMSQTGMTPEQTFAIWGLAGRAGGSASVIGRGIAQLLGNVLHPSTPEQQQAYMSIGLPTDPQTLRRMGAFNIIQRMLRSATTGPIRARNAFALNDENIDDPTSAIQAAGVSGINLNRVYGFFSRQESARQFVNLLAQGGVRGLQDYIRSQQRAINSNLIYEREMKNLQYRQLARFNTARQNISLSLARGVEWPLEHIAAPPVIAASNFLAGHRTARVATDAIAGALLLRAGVRRLLPGRLGRLMGRGGGGSAAATAAITAEELPRILGGVGGGQNGAPLGTRADPIWVVISPVSWALGSPGGMAPSTPGDGNPRGPRVFPFLRRNARRAIPFGGANPGTALATGVVAGSIAEGIWLTHGQPAPGVTRGDWTPAQQRMIAVADRFAGQFGHFDAQRAVELKGNMQADMTVKLVDAQGRTITVQEKKGVPVKLIPNNGPQMPNTKGKKGSSRGR